MTKGPEPTVKKRDAAKMREQASRGKRAEALVDNPLLKEAFDNVEKKLDEGWKSSSAEDREARERAYLLHRLLVQLRAEFRSIVIDGRNAARLLQDAEELEESATRNRRSKPGR